MSESRTQSLKRALGFFRAESNFLTAAQTAPYEGRWNMARQSQNKFIKRQKELERMRKAKEKMLRRQGKKDKLTEPDEAPASGEPADQP